MFTAPAIMEGRTIAIRPAKSVAVLPQPDEMSLRAFVIPVFVVPRSPSLAVPRVFLTPMTPPPASLPRSVPIATAIEPSSRRAVAMFAVPTIVVTMLICRRQFLAPGIDQKIGTAGRRAGGDWSGRLVPIVVRRPERRKERQRPDPEAGPPRPAECCASPRTILPSRKIGP
jgi:hypothetical protein